MIDVLVRAADVLAVVAICLGYWRLTQGRRDAEWELRRRLMRERRPRR